MIKTEYIYKMKCDPGDREVHFHYHNITFNGV